MVMHKVFFVLARWITFWYLAISNSLRRKLWGTERTIKAVIHRGHPSSEIQGTLEVAVNRNIDTPQLVTKVTNKLGIIFWLTIVLSVIDFRFITVKL